MSPQELRRWKEEKAAREAAGEADKAVVQGAIAEDGMDIDIPPPTVLGTLDSRSDPPPTHTHLFQSFFFQSLCDW